MVINRNKNYLAAFFFIIFFTAVCAKSGYGYDIHLKTEGKFDDKGRQGKWKFYMSENTVWVECTYQAGLISGEYVRYEISGNIEARGNYKEGLKEGEWQWFYLGGAKYASGAYHEGLRTGEWKWWHENSQLLRQGSYVNNEKTGVWKEYSSKGKPVKETDYGKVLSGHDSYGLHKDIITEFHKCLDATFDVEIEGEKFITAYQVPFWLYEEQMHEKIIRWAPEAVKTALGIKDAQDKPLFLLAFLTDSLLQDYLIKAGLQSGFYDSGLSHCFYHHGQRAIYTSFRDDNYYLSSGGLLHEMVHAVVTDDFPAIPVWFNEGLASLYEDSANIDGKITGLPYSRLEFLRERLSYDYYTSLDDLLEFNHREFNASREDDPLVNYALSRFLCYYLQEKGQLALFYNEFRKTFAVDPGGKQALLKITGFESMKKIEEELIKFVEAIDLEKFEIKGGVLWRISLN